MISMRYAYTFDERKPDVIVSLWDETGKEAEPYLTEYIYASIGNKLGFISARIRQISYGIRSKFRIDCVLKLQYLTVHSPLHRSEERVEKTLHLR